MKYLIVGLGNIGDEYRHTRHNIGFMILDAFAEASNISFSTGRYGDVGRGRVKNKQVVLLKPSTYMNLSGNAVRYWKEQEGRNRRRPYPCACRRHCASPRGYTRQGKR